jgi:hypothetical protein
MRMRSFDRCCYPGPFYDYPFYGYGGYGYRYGYPGLYWNRPYLYPYYDRF